MCGGLNIGRHALKGAVASMGLADRLMRGGMHNVLGLEHIQTILHTRARCGRCRRHLDNPHQARRRPAACLRALELSLYVLCSNTVCSLSVGFLPEGFLLH